MLHKENDLFCKQSLVKEKEMRKMSKLEKVDTDSNYMLEEFNDHKNVAFPSENIKFFTQFN